MTIVFSPSIQPVYFLKKDDFVLLKINEYIRTLDVELSGFSKARYTMFIDMHYIMPSALLVMPAALLKKWICINLKCNLK